LLGEFGKNPEIDAICATQSRRQSKFPLATRPNAETLVETDGSPLLITTGHFGLTLLRAECLKTVEKPWFYAEPDPDGGWGEGRLDDDIWFWHQWRKAGYTLYMAPSVRIGHLELMVSDFDEQLKHRQMTVPNWRKMYGVDDSKTGIDSYYEATEGAESSGQGTAAAEPTGEAAATPGELVQA